MREDKETGWLCQYLHPDRILHFTSISTEIARLPIVINSSTCSIAISVVLTASALSFALVGRMSGKLDMIGVLKARD
jgi:hypothetical protein